MHQSMMVPLREGAGVDEFLARIHASIASSRKWESPSRVACHLFPSYATVDDRVRRLAEGRPPCVILKDMYLVLDVVIGCLPLGHPFSLSMLVTDHGSGSTGVVLQCDGISPDFIAPFVNGIVGEEFAYDQGLDKEGATILEVLTGCEKYLVFLDYVNRKVAYSQEEFKTQRSMVTFVCNLDFAAEFEVFALKALIGLAFRPNVSFSCALGEECALINLPAPVDRIGVISSMLLPDAITHRVDYHYECNSIDGVSDAVLLCNMSRDTQGLFKFFMFCNGIPIVDKKVIHAVLSAVSWSRYSLSLVPAEKQGIPFCTSARALNERGMSYVLLVNTSLIESITLSVKAVDGVLEKLNKKLPCRPSKQRSLRRLDGIWLYVDTVLENLSSVFKDEFSTTKMRENITAMFDRGGVTPAHDAPDVGEISGTTVAGHIPWMFEL